MSKFTPGPWHVVERANRQAFSIGVQVQTKGNLLTTHYIANLTDMGTPQAEANARLIAAAPEMLAMLKGFATRLREFDYEDEIFVELAKLIKEVEGGE